MKDCRIALAQVNLPVKELDANLGKIAAVVQESAKAGADIVCFPELTVCGYCLGPYVTELAQSVPGPITEQVEAMAREWDITVIAGTAETASGGKVYNTEFVVSPEGYQGKYRKTHIPSPEIPYYAPGSDVRVFRHPKMTFGIITCYDSHFPELASSMVSRGAEVLFLPHASPMGETFDQKRTRWLRYMSARAYDNSVYVAVCNHVGDGGDQQFPGVTMVLDPWGEVIEEAKPEQEDLIVVDLSAAKLDEIRNDPIHYFGPYRRPELYAIEE